MQLPVLAKDIHMLKCNEEWALVTPLHVAIANKKHEIVHYIFNHLHVDLRNVLSCDIEYKNNHEFIKHLFPTQEKEEKFDFDGTYKSYYQLSGEQ